MSLPPLPEIFGNYALADLVGVTAPGSINWWPQTPGWQLLGLVVLVLILRGTWRRLQHWYRNRYRREALARLDAIAGHGELADWLAQLNKLLKLTAMAAFSRAEVARLSGNPWVDFLNQQCPQPCFDASLAPLLAQGPYVRPVLNVHTRQQLVTATSRWINGHRNPADV